MDRRFCGVSRDGAAPTARSLRGVVARHAVHDAVAPPPTAEVGASLDAFSPEARLLERPLLGNIVGFGTGLNPMGGGHVEEVPDKLTLGLGPDTAVPVLGEQGRTDLPVAVRTSRAPRDPARARSVAGDHGQKRLLAPDEAVLLPAPPKVDSVLQPVAEPLEFAGQTVFGEEAEELIQIGLGDGPELD